MDFKKSESKLCCNSKKDMKFSDICEQNTLLKNQLGLMNYKVAILSNIIVSQSKNIIEYKLRSNGIAADIFFGDYDNIVQDANNLEQVDCSIIFWELANIVDGLQYKADTISDVLIEELIEKTKQELKFCIDSLSNVSIVIFNRFSHTLFTNTNIRSSRFEYICSELNKYLDSQTATNLVLIDIDKVILQTGVKNSADYRFFYSSKSLYTIEFYINYAQYILPIIMSANGKSKKALIFDCDNTLWNGVLGEDGFNGINMSSKNTKGIVFEEIQSIAVKLAKQGVIIGLCTKNNFDDVQNVLENHPDMLLKDEHIVIKKINWKDKSANLKEISKELNIGLDSIVFIDDSDFEVNLVKEFLPEINVLQVPKKSYEYPQMIRENLELFFDLSLSKDDLQRVLDYKNTLQRKETKNNFENIDEYLKSLDINIKIYINHIEHIPRVAQLTQKTNQFNLTTQRYTESDIEKFMHDDLVFSIEVSDKFGNSGLTAVVIMEKNDRIYNINTFLMSCRIIGRNIEFVILDYIADFIKKLGIEKISSSYRKTLKNEQVNSFYEGMGFSVISNNSTKEYELILKKYKNKNINYIGVKNETKN